MFPIFADTFMTAARMDQPIPDYRALHPTPRPQARRPWRLSALWFHLS